MEYIIWMMDNLNKLTESEKVWVNKFKSLFYENMKEEKENIK